MIEDSIRKYFEVSFSLGEPIWWLRYEGKLPFSVIKNVVEMVTPDGFAIIEQDGVLRSEAILTIDIVNQITSLIEMLEK